MSGSRLLAGLFLVLGAADLLLLNVWLVPAAWPPSSSPSAEFHRATRTVVAGMPEVAGTAAPGNSAKLASQGELRTKLAEGTEAPQIAAIAPILATTDANPDEPNETPIEPAGPGLLNPAEGVEPQQAAEVISAADGTDLGPDGKPESAMEEVAEEPVAETTEAVEPQQGVPLLSSLADSEARPEEGAEDSATKPRDPDAATSAEPILASRDLGKTGQPSADPQYQPIHQAVVRFALDGDNLRSDAREILAQTVQVFRDHSDAEIQVDGHTDDLGNDDYNYRLSERRARAVAVVLEAAGIPAVRIKTRGYGPSQPIDVKSNAAARAKNRRVEITIRSRAP